MEKNNIISDWLEKNGDPEITKKVEEELEKLTNNKYDPYCPVCSGCGEEGCCSPLICKQSPDGHYCESYLNDLKFAYRMYNWIMENIVFESKDEERLNEAWDEIYDEVYKVDDNGK